MEKSSTKSIQLLLLSALFVTACSSGGGAAISPDSGLKPGTGGTVTPSSSGGAVAVAGSGGASTPSSIGVAGSGGASTPSSSGGSTTTPGTGGATPTPIPDAGVLQLDTGKLSPQPDAMVNPDTAAAMPSDTAVPKDAPGATPDAPTKLDTAPTKDSPVATVDAAEPKNTLTIAVGGSDSNPGTREKPLATIKAAALMAQPGTLITMLAGTYSISAPVNLDTPAGTAANPIRLWADPGAQVILDFATATAAGKGLSINASYWHVKGLIVENCPGRGIQVMKGDHITVENCETRNNGDMGLVVSEGATNALILNCDSHHNFDVENAGENADGFGAKSNLGEGTIFRGCRAWANADDGWDLYNCPTSVRFENCWSYKNGDNFKNMASFAGDGNGFKLGKSDSTTSHHVLVNTVAFSNLGGNGFEDNDNISGLTFYNCVSYNNPKAGFEAVNVSKHVLKNNISYKNGKADNILAGSDVSNNSWNGLTVSDADFLSLNDGVITGPRNPDGSLPDSDFLKLAPASALIDKGVDVGLPWKGAAPDLGAYEAK
jgi:pectate disaccharide-lyase